jgi:glycosyltransferase involved in cell wall biosynthesis
MRILLVHNFYGSTAPSGENELVKAECELLKAHGHEVELFSRHSDEIRNGTIRGLAKGALCTIANPFAARNLAIRIRSFNPDVVHVHNTFPLISPLAIRTASKLAPVVLTVHNYRTQCAAGTPTRGGQICTTCLERQTVWPAVINRCYRESLVSTMPLAMNITIYRHALLHWVSRAIVLSDFQRDRMIECGWPSVKLMVKGNFVKVLGSEICKGEKRSGCCYVGRLSNEKGVSTLIEAWRILGANAPRLTIVGDGDARAEYEKLAHGLDIRFVGKLPHEDVLALLSQTLFIVQPSVCWETFGLTVAEAASLGTPAIVSDVGTLPEFVRGGGGRMFKVGDAGELAQSVRKMLNDADWEKMSAAAVVSAKRFSPEKNYAKLIDVYKAAKAEWESHRDARN